MSEVQIRSETQADHDAVLALIDQVFGPGRYSKVSERLREGNAPFTRLSMVATHERRIIGCARMWPVIAGGVPLAFLGPLAVEVSERNGGLGGRLVSSASDAALAAGLPAVLLVGDPEYFGPLGFVAGPASALMLPGPVDPRRVLIKGQTKGALEGRVVIGRQDAKEMSIEPRPQPTYLFENDR